MAETLSNAAGCTVSEGTYREYENSNKPVLMPLGLLWHFAKLTDTTLEALLAPVAHPGFAGYRVSADDIREYANGSVPMPHHLLFPFCETLGTTLEELLAPVDPQSHDGGCWRDSLTHPRARRAAAQRVGAVGHRLRRLRPLVTSHNDRQRGLTWGTDR